MPPVTNSSISVDCVVFGFDGSSLKVLLVKRRYREADASGDEVYKEDYKLPGSPIFDNEDLTTSAYRILEEITSIRNIYLKQLHVFSDPARLSERDLAWLNSRYGMDTRRIITIAYYSLVKLNRRMTEHTALRRAEWHDVQSVKKLALDHKEILMMALSTLNRQLLNEPIAFELLPRKFTIRQLQTLYEAILGVEIDNRNFRKKLLTSGYLRALGDKEEGVAHKPAQYYMFDKARYETENRKRTKLNFINWHE